MEKLIILGAYNLAMYLYLLWTAGWWTTNMCLDRLVFLDKFLPQLLHCSGKQRRSASGLWSSASGGTRCYNMLGLCVYIQCICFTFSWWTEPWSRSCSGRRQGEKRTKGNLNIISLAPGFPAYPTHPSSSLASPHHHHHPPYSPPSPIPSGDLEGLQALLPLLQGPVGTWISAYRPGLLLPPDSKRITGLKLFKTCKKSDRYHKTVISALSILIKLEELIYLKKKWKNQTRN